MAGPELSDEASWELKTKGKKGTSGKEKLLSHKGIFDKGTSSDNGYLDKGGKGTDKGKGKSNEADKGKGGKRKDKDKGGGNDDWMRARLRFTG